MRKLARKEGISAWGLYNGPYTWDVGRIKDIIIELSAIHHQSIPNKFKTCL